MKKMQTLEKNEDGEIFIMFNYRFNLIIKIIKLQQKNLKNAKNNENDKNIQENEDK